MTEDMRNTDFSRANKSSFQKQENQWSYCSFISKIWNQIAHIWKTLLAVSTWMIQITWNRNPSLRTGGVNRLKGLYQQLKVSKCLLKTIVSQWVWALKQSFYWISTWNTVKYPNFVCFEISSHVAQVNLESWFYYVVEDHIELWILLLSIPKYTVHYVIYEVLGSNPKS